MNLPGFTAQTALSQTRSSRATFDHGDHAMRGSLSISPRNVLGAVPAMYRSLLHRECKRVPYTVCDARGCRRERRKPRERIASSLRGFRL